MDVHVCVRVCVGGGVKRGSKYHNFNTYAHMNFIRTYARTCRKFFLNKKRILYV